MAITVGGFSVVLADRARETTQTTGTGTYSLDGAATGFRTLVSGVGSGNRTTYTVVLGSNWETTIGTVTSGSPATVSRDSILASSNAGSAVNWGAGIKDIFIDASAAVLDAMDARITSAIAAITPQFFGQFDASSLPRDVTIPTTARSATVHFSNFQLTGTGNLLVQLGTGGVADTTSTYVSHSGSINAAGASGVLTSSTSFLVWMGEANRQAFGNMYLHHMGGNLWTQSHAAALTAASAAAMSGGGAKQMSGAVNLIRIAAVGGQTPDGWLGVTVGF